MQTAVLVWWWAGGAWKLEFCQAVSEGGFKALGVESLLPYLEGEIAYGEYLRKRAETNEKAAATRALTAIFEPLITPVLRELLAAGVPRAWLAGGLVCDGKRITVFLKKIDKGEEQGDGADRAGG